MNLDQPTLLHVALGAAIVFLILRHLGWQKPQPPSAAMPMQPPYQAPPWRASSPAAGLANAVAFEIPNLPVKAVITLQPEQGGKP